MFNTTRWSLVIETRADSDSGRLALDTLCRAYRSPVVSYLRARGHSPSDAEDLAQAFFEQLLVHRLHAAADPERGRFRAFLLTALKRHLANQRDHETALKRGGGQVLVALDEDDAPADAGALTPEQAFERDYALTVIERALERLRQEAIDAGKLALFDEVRGFLLEPPDPSEYAVLSARLNLRRNTLAVAIHRLRNRMRAMVRAELGDTVESAAALEAEMAALQGILEPAPPVESGPV
ncbi:RNA polymerase sigma factor [Pseudoxanthomonas daejeonensis]|nr:sigma-70 family RNA polymerase sigma factor [Pseudoxanthomonas daejeonensis]